MTGKFVWDLVIASDGKINAKYIACNSCQHLRDNDKCKAFPGGIPEDILVGENDHTEPYPGDHGIQFEPVNREEQP